MERPDAPRNRRALTPAEIEEIRVDMEAAGRRLSLRHGIVIGFALGFAAACMIYALGWMPVLMPSHPAV